MGKGANLTGVVTARKCPQCGHHEIGFVTEDGIFHPFKPGMAVGILEPSEMVLYMRDEEMNLQSETAIEEDREDFTPWVPVQVLLEKTLRLKYGVKVRTELSSKTMTPETYRSAYLDKLTDLLAKETLIPLPVILDKFFAAPHLASGNPRQIAEAMWKELKEVRDPVQTVEKWLTSENTKTVDAVWMDIMSEVESPHNPSRAEVLRELAELSLEDFLALL